MMNTDEREEPNASLSILQRLDRLERLMLFLEEKHSYTKADSAAAVDKFLKPVKQCKSLSTALEEVHHRGTLIERVALLENRVNQLSINMEVGNTSRSSSSTSAVAEKLGHGLGLQENGELNEDMNMVTTLQEKQKPLITKESIVVEACSLNSPSCKAHRRHNKTMSGVDNNRKWLKWLKLGC